MGQSGSKSKNESLLGRKSKKKGGDDGCMGNRKVRTILLSILLIVFFAMALAWLFDRQDYYNNPDTALQVFCALSSSDYCDDAANAWNIIIAGACCAIASAIFAILLFFINCDDKCGRIAGIGLVIGGLMYIIGWSWYLSAYDNLFGDYIPDSQKDQYDAMLTNWFGEALLSSGSAILLGLDVFLHFFDSEFKRLLFNLLNLLVVCCLCGPTYYINSDFNQDDTTITTGLIQSDAYPWIATGYIVIGVTCTVYIILYICTCCTCNCKDTACIRLLLAFALIVGAVLSAIGYYIYCSDINSGVSDDVADPVLYYIGYTILLCGICLAWALDIGLDDVKG